MENVYFKGVDIVDEGADWPVVYVHDSVRAGSVVHFERTRVSPDMSHKADFGAGRLCTKGGDENNAAFVTQHKCP